MSSNLIKSPAGGVFNGADLTGDAQFFVIYSVIAHEAGNYGDATSAARNTRLLGEMIQQKVNMNYINISSAAIDLTDSDNRTFYGLGTDYNQAATDVFTIKFMVEQSGFMSAADLAGLLEGLEVPFETTGVPITGPSTRDEDAYETDSASAKNINIILSEDL